LTDEFVPENHEARTINKVKEGLGRRLPYDKEFKDITYLEYQSKVNRAETEKH
jgi:hypothetical protein